MQPVGDLVAAGRPRRSTRWSSVLLCDDLDLYADEVAASVAARLGFGEQFEAAVDVALG